MKLLVSLSALPPSLYRKYVKGWNKERYADLFRKYTGDRNNYRIHIPLVAGSKRIAYAVVPEAIQSFVASKGYTVEDYITGIAVDATGKRRIRIGKLLPPELQKVFAEDKTRSNARNAATGNQMVVISRHPYDIAGMSTGRGWVSCMNLIAGSNARYVMDDIRQGSIIAYLVNNTDINLQRPAARILLRVYKAENGKRGLFPSGIYGAGSELFFDTVRKWCSEVNNTYFGIPYGMSMSLLDDLYNDGINHVTNDNYDPAEAMKDLEAALRKTPEGALDQLSSFSARFGSDVSVFYRIANNIKSNELDAVLAPAAVAKIRSMVADNNISSDYDDAAEIAMRGFRNKPSMYGKDDALSLIHVSALMGNKLLTLVDGVKIAATLRASDPDLSMSKIYAMLMDRQASRALLDAAPKFGISHERALSLMVSDTYNNWHRVALDKAEIKVVKKSLAEDGIDELPLYYAAALAQPAKIPAMFKSLISSHNSEVMRGRTTGTSYNPDVIKLLIERMPPEKWSTAFRGIPVLPLLIGSTYARDTDKRALAKMEPFLAARTAMFLKNDTKLSSRMLRMLSHLSGTLNGRQFSSKFFEAIPDNLWLEPAASVLGLDILRTGAGDRARLESELGLSAWISSSPIRVMTLANTEDFYSGPIQAVMEAITADTASCLKIIANIKSALQVIPDWSYKGAQTLPLVLAATTIVDYKTTADEAGTDLYRDLYINYGVKFSKNAVNILLRSGLGTL